MKGSLHLPLRGAPQDIVYAHRSLYVRALHEEDASLGLYRIPLHEIIRGELTEEVFAESAGLLQLSASERFKTIAFNDRDGLLWAISDQAELYTLAEGESALKSHGQIEALDCGSALFCVADGIYALSSKGEGEDLVWTLSHSKIGEDRSSLVTHQLWCGEFGNEAKPTVSKTGPGVISFGLSDGRVALWFESTRRETLEGEWSPLFAQTHADPICALGFVTSDNKDYLLSYSEDLTLAQTRLDDLEPMPRAAKAKGLHSSPPVALISGPFGRFYTLGQDGVKAWRDDYSNLRPVSHDEPGEALNGDLRSAALVEFPKKNLDGMWELEPALAILGDQQVLIYSLLNPSEEAAIEQGVDDSAQRGRLSSSPAWRAEGERAWTSARLRSDDEATRQTTIDQLITWGDHSSLKALEGVAARDPNAEFRKTALSAIISSHHPTVMHALKRLLSSEHSTTSKGAFKALRKVYGKESLYPMKSALEVGELAVTIEALAALGERGERGDDQAKSLLKEEMNHDELERAECARAQLERCYVSPRSLLTGLEASLTEVKTMALHRLWEEGLTGDPIVSGRLQLSREDESESVRRYALAVTLLGHESLAELLRARDTLLHEELNKVSARRLKGEERAQALSVIQPDSKAEQTLDERARQLLFEISASGREDIAVYGPIALAAIGDLRALPTLLALSRSSSLFVKLRATRGLSDLAQGGERRAQAQLERLMSDASSEVRLCAYQGLASLHSHGIDHARLGLSAKHHDVRLAGLAALQANEVYRAGMSLKDDESDLRTTLAAALCHADDLGLAQEARKLYLKDLIGGSKEGALLLILESVHDEVRRLALSDFLGELQGGSSIASSGGQGGGGLAGQSFLFTGTLTTMKRSDAQKKVTALGGVAASSVNSSLSYLVIGDAGKAGSKLTKAKSVGVSVISETEFNQMLEEASLPATPVADISINEGEKEQSREAVISALLNDPLRSLRQEAHKRIVGRSEGEGALTGEQRLKAIDLALTSEHQDISLCAIESLSESTDQSSILPRLRELVASADPVIAQASLQATLNIVDEGLESLIVENLGSEYSSMRSLAVQAAAKASKKLSWREEILLRAISDGVSEIRDLAFEALKGDEVVSVAAKLLDHEQLSIRDRAALTLARVGDERALSVALDALSTPAPKAEEVIAAQEAMGGDFGLLDDLQWKRQVTLALSAQQRAFAAASASAESQVESASLSANASASATGIAYAEQSLHALVSVNDHIEGAVARAHRQWRARMSAGAKIISEGRFEGGFDAIWTLIEQAHQAGESSLIDEALMTTLSATLRHCTPPEAAGRLASRLKGDDTDHTLAWALVSLGDQRGFNSLAKVFADDEPLIEGALMIGGSNAERSLAQVINRGGRCAEVVMYAQIITLITFGGECPLLIAGLSSDDPNLRRRCAEWVSKAHDIELLSSSWHQEMEQRRPEEDQKWEREMALFESGERDKKPKGTKPQWMEAECWTLLAECLVHSEARTRAYAAEALLNLPRHRDEAKNWMLELRRQHRLGQTCAQRRGITETSAPKSIALSLSRDEAEALAFGTYASLITSRRDAHSLEKLSSLFTLDPMGSRALLQMSLRLDDALQRRALRALEEEGEVLQLSDLNRAELLISSAQPSCIEQGAQLLARVDPLRAESLVRNDDGIGAESALKSLLELFPERGFDLLRAGFESPNETLRVRSVKHWVNLLNVWPSEKKPLADDDEKTASKLRIEQLEVKLLRALSASQTREYALDKLLEVFGSKEREALGIDVQIVVSEQLIHHGQLKKKERNQLVKPLKSLIASTEPKLYRRALNCLRDLKAEGAAQVALDRLLNDPTMTADAYSTWSALSVLRDPTVTPKLLELMDDPRWTPDGIEQCILSISGYDDPIDEDAIWSEMDQEEREEEIKRAYHDETLATLMLRCIQLGRYETLEWRLDLVNVAKTVRSDQVDEVLVKLTRLPEGPHTDDLRECSLEALRWRVENRDFDPSPLESLIKHRNDKTRKLAAIALGYGKNGAGSQLLMGVARDKGESYHWRQESIKALGVSGDLRAVRTLMALFDDQEDDLRSEALEGLGYMSKSEVADDILKRLIEGLEEYHFAEAAISGIRKFNLEPGWRALRKLLLSSKMSSWINDQMIEALNDDPSEEAFTTLKKVLVEGDLFGNSSRINAYKAWCTRLIKPLELDRVEQNAALLPAAIVLFKTDLTYYDEWENAVEIILEHGEAELWIDLCFGTSKLGYQHQSTISRFEAKLRELNPAPLSQLLPRLAEAIEDAPKIAEMTLGLIGGDSASLSRDDRAVLLSVTEDLSTRWREMEVARQAGSPQSKQAELTQLWRSLLWLWGRGEGGATAIWKALETEGLSVELYREALFSLEALAQREGIHEVITDRLLKVAVSKVPALSSMVSRLALSADLATEAFSDDRLESLGGLGLADWDAINQGSASLASKQAVSSVRQGDSFALNALLSIGDSASVLSLFEEIKRGSLNHLEESAQLNLISAAARLASEEVEHGLVELAKGLSSETLQREAWRARRRSIRRRQQRERYQLDSRS